MQQYLDLMNDVIKNGHDKKDRTGVGTRSVFGRQMRFDLSKGFPLMTTKKIHLPSVVHELLWFLKGDTNVEYLRENKVKIWNAWATEDGSLGPVYGHQWRSWQGVDGQVVDQISRCVETLKTNPDSRRIIVSAWRPDQLPLDGLSPQENVEKGFMALAPCHCLFQFYVIDGKLSCLLYQRSADLFLGVPFNIASYALLTHMIAQQCDLIPGEFIHSFGDLHLYQNHINEEIVYEQLSRKPQPLPELKIASRAKSVFDYKYEDFSWTNYNPLPGIKAPIAV